MRKLLLAACLMLPGLALAAVPTISWEKEKYAASRDGPNVPITMTLSGTPFSQNTVVNFYWFSEPVERAEASGTVIADYVRDFYWVGTTSHTAFPDTNSPQGRGSVTFPANSTSSSVLKIDPASGHTNDYLQTIYIILDARSEYGLSLRHATIAIYQDSDTEKAQFSLTTRTGLGQSNTVGLYKTDPQDIAQLKTVTFQSKAPGGSWTTLITNPCTRFRCPGYTSTIDLDGHQLRARVNYVDGSGLDTTVTTNEIGPLEHVYVSFAQRDFSAKEEDEVVTVTAILSHELSSSRTVRFSSTPLTATASGVDFLGQIYSITFPARTTSASTTITIVRDNTITNDSEADTETFRVDLYPLDFPDWLKAGSRTQSYVLIQNYKLPVISLTDIDKVADERTYEGVALNSNQDVPYEEAVTVLARAKAKNGNTFDLSGSLFGKVGVSSTDRVPFASEDTLYCVWLPQQSRYYTASSRSATEPSTNWSICPSGVTILVKNTGETAQERAQQPPPDPDPPAVMTSINDCVQSGNLSLSTVEDYATNRSPADNRFNRILSALYERTTPAPLTASEANVFYQNNRGGDNEDFYKAVYDTLTCVEGL